MQDTELLRPSVPGCPVGGWGGPERGRGVEYIWPKPVGPAGFLLTTTPQKWIR